MLVSRRHFLRGTGLAGWSLAAPSDLLAQMLRTGVHDLRLNPINVALSGTIGTWAGGWPSSGIRGTPATPSAVLDLDEKVTPLEQHGFTLVDFAPDRMVLRMFKWDISTQPVEAIDTLAPFHVAELVRPA